MFCHLYSCSGLFWVKITTDEFQVYITLLVSSSLFTRFGTDDEDEKAFSSSLKDEAR